MNELESMYSKEINDHCDWLKSFDKQRLDKWKQLLKDNPEAAICEAATRKILSEHEVKVVPYEDLSSGGPDFRCTKDNKCFYVEVTCISKNTTTKKTGLSDELPKPSRVQRFRLPTQKIFYELCNKASQCRSLDAACILAISTLHFQAGAVCFSKPLNKKVAEHLLIGTPQITTNIDPEQGIAIGDLHQTTDLQNSGFVRPNRTSTDSIDDARRTISSVLLCSFGTIPACAVGVLHPNPNHSFDRSLLPNIEFCRLAEGYQTGQLKIEWI